MDPKTILELGANGVILFGTISFFIWLFRFYLPQTRDDFIKSLGDAITRFEQMRKEEAELHKDIQREEMEAHKQEILVLKSEINLVQQEMRAFNSQFGHFITIFISLFAKDTKSIVELAEKLRGEK